MSNTKPSIKLSSVDTELVVQAIVVSFSTESLDYAGRTIQLSHVVLDQDLPDADSVQKSASAIELAQKHLGQTLESLAKDLMK